MDESNPIITEPFYLKKFMQIQRENVLLHNMLSIVYRDEELRKLAIERAGFNLFLILEKTTKFLGTPLCMRPPFLVFYILTKFGLKIFQITIFNFFKKS